MAHTSISTAYEFIAPQPTLSIAYRSNMFVSHITSVENVKIPVLLKSHHKNNIDIQSSYSIEPTTVK